MHSVVPRYTVEYVVVGLSFTNFKSSVLNMLSTSWSQKVLFGYLKKNQSTPRPSEHPPAMGEKMHCPNLCGVSRPSRLLIVVVRRSLLVRRPGVSKIRPLADEA